MTSEISAAPPLLGSTLLALEESHSERRPLPASSGSAAIDESALEGGFRYGEITSIAGTTGTGKTLLAYNAAASHLLAHASGEVAFVDTAGSFSPVRLRDVLLSQLTTQNQRTSFVQTGYVYERTLTAADLGDEEILQEANSTLDRVKVMRVFDLAGVAEAVGEVTAMVERTSPTADPRVDVPVVPEEPKEIGDSEDDSMDGDSIEIEPRAQNKPSTTASRVSMIIVDTMTNVVSSTVSKNQLQGQALLASLMRSLNQLTTRHHVCTILTNAVVGMNASKNLGYKLRPEDHVSIFASTLGKPALGKAFTYLIDTSIFLSAVPKSQNDAVSAYGERIGPQKWRSAIILEVLKDRNGTRAGRWTAFEMVSDVKLVPC